MTTTTVNVNPSIIATSIPTANVFPIADSNGTLNAWISKNPNPGPNLIIVSNDNGNALDWIPITVLAVATGNATTTSSSDIVVPGMTLTPTIAGIYDVDFTSSMGNSSAANTNFVSIYAGGTQFTGSSRTITSPASGFTGFASTAQVTVNGTQVIEGRWSTTGGTMTMATRILRIRQVG